MIEVQNGNKTVSIVKVSQEELLDFAKEYLKKHTYVSSKKLSTAYLHEHYDLSYRDLEYIRISKTLSHRFRYIIMLLTKDRLIIGYNNGHLYKRVELPKTDSCSIIDKSLCVDSSKTEPETNEVKLIYYQGKFVNPKLYDLT